MAPNAKKFAAVKDRHIRNASELLTKAVGKSVTIASPTTSAGFAALIPVSHRGIPGLGRVLALGVVSILAATVLVLPALFEVIARKASSTQVDGGAAVEKPRRAASDGLGMLAVAAFLAAALLYPAGASAGSGAWRARSDKLVREAEAAVFEAGKGGFTDSAKVRAAIGKLHEALEIDPQNDGAYVDLGFCHALLRETDRAIEMYRRATLINPSPANFKELADVYLRAGKPEMALMAANAGLAGNPRSAGLHNARGMALNDLLRFDEAAKAFRHALVYDPSFQVARQNLEAIGRADQIPDNALTRDARGAVAHTSRAHAEPR